MDDAGQGLPMNRRQTSACLAGYWGGAAMRPRKPAPDRRDVAGADRLCAVRADGLARGHRARLGADRRQPCASNGSRRVAGHLRTCGPGRAAGFPERLWHGDDGADRTEFNHSILGVLERKHSVIEVRTVVLIALLALVRKFIIIDAAHAEPLTVARAGRRRPGARRRLLACSRPR